MATETAPAGPRTRPGRGKPCASKPAALGVLDGSVAHVLGSGARQSGSAPQTLLQSTTSGVQTEQPSGRTDGDEQLVEAVTHGDQDALATLYDRYASVCFGLALKLLGDRAAAEEAVQEVFWRVWQRAGSFDRTRRFSPWLLSIAHNYCIDELRRSRVRPQLVDGEKRHPILYMIPDETDVEHTVLCSEQHRIVVDALHQLPGRQRQVLELAYFRGFTHQEIADQLGDPLGTVKTRIRLGLQKLRTLFEEQGLIQES